MTMLTQIELTPSEPLLPPPATKTFKFVFAKEVVEWQICYQKVHPNMIALISCRHNVFRQYFPDGSTRINQLIAFIRNETGINPNISFFVRLLDSFLIT